MWSPFSFERPTHEYTTDALVTNVKIALETFSLFVQNAECLTENRFFCKMVNTDISQFAAQRMFRANIGLVFTMEQPKTVGSLVPLLMFFFGAVPLATASPSWNCSTGTDFCLLIPSERRTWHEASTNCFQRNGGLAHSDHFEV